MGNSRSDESLSSSRSPESWDWNLNDEAAVKPSVLLRAEGFNKVFARILDRISTNAIEMKGMREEFDLRAAAAEEMLKFQQEYSETLPQDPTSKASPESIISANFNSSFRGSSEFLGRNLSIKQTTASSIELATNRLKLIINTQISSEEKLDKEAKRKRDSANELCDDVIKALQEAEECKLLESKKSVPKDDYKLRLLPLIIDELLDGINSIQKSSAVVGEDAKDSLNLQMVMEGLSQISSNFIDSETIESGGVLVVTSITRLVVSLNSLYESPKLSPEYKKILLTLVAQLSVLGGLLSWQYWTLAQMIHTENLDLIEQGFSALKQQTYEASCKNRGFPIAHRKNPAMKLTLPEVCPSGKFKEVLLFRTREHLLAQHERMIRVMEMDATEPKFNISFELDWDKDCKPFIIGAKFWCFDKNTIYPIQDPGNMTFDEFKTQFGIKLPDANTSESNLLLKKVVKVLGNSLIKPEAIHLIENCPIPGVIIRVIQVDCLPGSNDPAKSTVKQSYRLLQYLAIDVNENNNSLPNFKVVDEILLKPFHGGEPGKNSSYFSIKAVDRYAFIGPRHFVAVTKVQQLEIFDLVSGQAICQTFQLHEITSKINFDTLSDQLLIMESDTQLAQYDFSNAAEFFSDLDLNLCHRDGKNKSKEILSEKISKKSINSDTEKISEARQYADLAIKELGLIEDPHLVNSQGQSSTDVPTWTIAKDSISQVEAIQLHYTEKGPAAENYKQKFSEASSPKASLRIVLDCMMTNALMSTRLSNGYALSTAEICKELSSNKGRYELSAGSFQNLTLLVKQVLKLDEFLSCNTMLKLLELYLTDITKLQHAESSVVLASQECLFSLREALFLLQKQTSNLSCTSLAVEFKTKQRWQPAAAEYWCPVEVTRHKLLFSIEEKLIQLCADCRVFPWKCFVEHLFSQNYYHENTVLDRVLRTVCKNIPMDADKVTWNRAVLELIQSKCIELIRKVEITEFEFLKGYSPKYPLSAKQLSSLPPSQARNLSKILMILTRLLATHQKESISNPVFKVAYDASRTFLKGLAVCLSKNNPADVDAFVWSETVLGSLFYRTLVLSIYDEKRSTHEDTISLIESFMEATNQVESTSLKQTSDAEVRKFTLKVNPSVINPHTRSMFTRVESNSYSHLVIECSGQDSDLDTIGIFTVHESDNWNCDTDAPQYIKNCVPYRILPHGASVEVPSNDICIAVIADTSRDEASREIQVTVKGRNKIMLDDKLGLKVLYRICNYEMSKRIVETLKSKDKAYKNITDSKFTADEIRSIEKLLKSNLFDEQGLEHSLMIKSSKAVDQIKEKLALPEVMSEKADDSTVDRNEQFRQEFTAEISETTLKNAFESSGLIQAFLSLVALLQEKICKKSLNSKILGTTGTQVCQTALLLLLKFKYPRKVQLSEYLKSTNQPQVFEELMRTWSNLVQLRVEYRNQITEEQQTDFFKKLLLIECQRPHVTQSKHSLQVLSGEVTSHIYSRKISAGKASDLVLEKEGLLSEYMSKIEEQLSTGTDIIAAGVFLQQVFMQQQQTLLLHIDQENATHHQTLVSLAPVFAGLGLATACRCIPMLITVFVDILTLLSDPSRELLPPHKLTGALQTCTWNWTPDQAEFLVHMVDFEVLYATNRTACESSVETMQSLVKLLSTLRSSTGLLDVAKKWFETRANEIVNNHATRSTFKSIKQDDWFEWKDQSTKHRGSELEFWQTAQHLINLEFKSKNGTNNDLHEEQKFLPIPDFIHEIHKQTDVLVDSLSSRIVRNKKLKSYEASFANLEENTTDLNGPNRQSNSSEPAATDNCDDGNFFGGLFDEAPAEDQGSTPEATRKVALNTSVGRPDISHSSAWALSILSSIHTQSTISLPPQSLPCSPLTESVTKSVEILRKHYYECLFSKRRAVDSGKWRLREILRIRAQPEGLAEVKKLVQQNLESGLALALEIADCTPTRAEVGHRVRLCGDPTLEDYIVLPRYGAKDALQYSHSLQMIQQDITQLLPFRDYPSFFDTVNGYQLLMCVRTGKLRYASIHNIEPAPQPGLGIEQVKFIFSKPSLLEIAKESDTSAYGLFKLWRVTRIIESIYNDHHDEIVSLIMSKVKRVLCTSDITSKIPLNSLNQEIQNYIDSLSASEEFFQISQKPELVIEQSPASQKYCFLRSKIYKQTQSMIPSASWVPPNQDSDFNIAYYPAVDKPWNPEYLLGSLSKQDEPPQHSLKQVLAGAIASTCNRLIQSGQSAPGQPSFFLNELLPSLPSNTTDTPYEQTIPAALALLQDSQNARITVVKELLDWLASSNSLAYQIAHLYIEVCRLLFNKLLQDKKNPDCLSLLVRFTEILIKIGLDILSQGIKHVQNNLKVFQLFVNCVIISGESVHTLQGRSLGANSTKALSAALRLIVNRDSLSPLSASKPRGIEHFSKLVFYFTRKIVQHLKIDAQLLDEEAKKVYCWLELKNFHFNEATSNITSADDISVKGILLRSLAGGYSDDLNKWKVDFTSEQKEVELEFLKEYPHWLQLAHDKEKDNKAYSLGIYLQDQTESKIDTWFKGVNLENSSSPVLSIATRFSTPEQIITGAAKAISRTNFTQNFASTSSMTQFDTPLLNRQAKDFAGAWGGTHFFIVDNNVHYTERDTSIVDINAISLWKDNKASAYYKRDTKQLVVSLNDSIHDSGIPYRLLLDSDRNLSLYHFDMSDFPPIQEGLFVGNNAAALVKDALGRFILLDPERTMREVRKLKGLNFINFEYDTKESTTTCLRSGLFYLFENSKPWCWPVYDIFAPNPSAIYKLTHISNPDRNSVIIFGLQSNSDARVVVWNGMESHARVIEFKDQSIQKIMAYGDFLVVLFETGKVYSIEDMNSLPRTPGINADFICNPTFNNKLGKVYDIILIYRSAIIGIEEVDHSIELATLPDSQPSNYYDYTTKGRIMRLQLILGSNFNPPIKLEGLLTPETRFMENSSVDSREIMLKNTRVIRNASCKNCQFSENFTLSTPSVISVKGSTDISICIPIDYRSELELIGCELKTPITVILLNLFMGGVSRSGYQEALKEYKTSKLFDPSETEGRTEQAPPEGVVACLFSPHPHYASNPLKGVVWLNFIPENLLDLEKDYKDPIFLFIADRNGFRSGLPQFISKIAVNAQVSNYDNLRVHFLPDFDKMNSEEFQKLKSDTEAIWKPYLQQVEPKLKEYHKIIMNISWKCVENSRSSRSTLMRFLTEARNISETEEYSKFAEVIPKDFDKEMFSIVFSILAVVNFYLWEWLAQAPFHQGKCLDSSFVSSCSKNFFGVTFLSHFKIVSRESQSNVSLNRIKSRFASTKVDPRMSLLAQLSSQVDYQRKEIISNRMDIDRIKMNLVGEGSNDAGGPRREIFEEICDEITNKLKILVPTPNNADNVGEDRDKFGPNIRENSQYDDYLLYGFGVMLGGAIITADCLPISLPKLFWKLLQYQDPDWEDYEFFCFNQAQSLEYIESLEPEQLGGLDSKLTISLEDGSIVEIVPGGASIALTSATRQLYVSKVRSVLMGHFIRPLLQIRRGFETMVGRGTTSMISTPMLERYVCGMDMVN